MPVGARWAGPGADLDKAIVMQIDGRCPKPGFKFPASEINFSFCDTLRGFVLSQNPKTRSAALAKQTLPY